MARKKQAVETAFVLFNILYDDGSQSSNRKVPTGTVDIGDKAAVKAFLEADDRRLAQLSGKTRGDIKSVTKVGK